MSEKKGLIESSLASEKNFSLTRDNKLRVRMPKGLRFVKLRREDAPNLRSRLFVVPPIGKGYGNIVPPAPSIPWKERGYYWWMAQGIHYGITPRMNKSLMQDAFRTVMLESRFRVPKRLLALEKELRKKKEGVRTNIALEEETSDVYTDGNDTEEEMDTSDIVNSGRQAEEPLKAVTQSTRNRNVLDSSTASRNPLSQVLLATNRVATIGQKRKKDRKSEQKPKRKRVAAIQDEADSIERDGERHMIHETSTGSATYRKLQSQGNLTRRNISVNLSRRPGTVADTPRGVHTRFRSLSVSSHESEAQSHSFRAQTSEASGNSPTEDRQIIHAEDSDNSPLNQNQHHLWSVEKFSTPQIDDDESTPTFHTPPTSRSRRRDSIESVIHIESRPVNRHGKGARATKAFPTPFDTVIEVSSDDEAGLSEAAETAKAAEVDTEFEAGSKKHDDTECRDQTDEDRKNCQSSNTAPALAQFMGIPHIKETHPVKLMGQSVEAGAPSLDSRSARENQIIRSVHRDSIQRAQAIANKLLEITETPASAMAQTREATCVNTLCACADLSLSTLSMTNQGLQPLDHLSYQGSVGNEISDLKGSNTMNKRVIRDGRLMDLENSSINQINDSGACKPSRPQISSTIVGTYDPSLPIRQSEVQTSARRVGMLAIESNGASPNIAVGVPFLRGLLYPHDHKSLPGIVVPLDFQSRSITALPIDDLNSFQATTPSRGPCSTSTSLPTSSNPFAMRQVFRDNAPSCSSMRHRPTSPLSTYPNNVEIKSPSFPRSAPRSSSKKRSFEETISYRPDSKLDVDLNRTSDYRRPKNHRVSSLCQERGTNAGNIVSDREARRLAREMGIAQSIEGHV